MPAGRLRRSPGAGSGSGSSCRVSSAKADRRGERRNISLHEVAQPRLVTRCELTFVELSSIWQDTTKGRMVQALEGTLQERRTLVEVQGPGRGSGAAPARCHLPTPHVRLNPMPLNT